MRACMIVYVRKGLCTYITCFTIFQKDVIIALWMGVDLLFWFIPCRK